MPVRLGPASRLSRKAARNPGPGQTQSGDSGEGRGVEGRLQSRPDCGASPARGGGGSTGARGRGLAPYLGAWSCLPWQEGSLLGFEAISG